MTLALALPFMPFVCAGSDCRPFGAALLFVLMETLLLGWVGRNGGEEGAMAEMAGSSSNSSRYLAARSSIAAAMEIGFGTVSKDLFSSLVQWMWKVTNLEGICTLYDSRLSWLRACQ